MVLFITGLLPYKEGLLPVLLPTLWGEGWRAVDTVSAESGSRLPVAAYCVHASQPVSTTDEKCSTYISTNGPILVLPQLGWKKMDETFW
ncbi:hypothetical protein ECARS42123_1645 [Escherichia coli ARS4.2123]|nr:hypothetical protein ECARS42123_1645 [Escherichia coli ARS4.2123]